ncbi:MAG: PaaI family thioesterase [Anaerolineae bacterium]|nr:PaaI family thioesterase [Anaerolineae bacterium]MCO5196390.1 PaaI family thioesterase [Anaerolineae bacterium]MCO5204310.1 PaaI family thioesterase [Anaerolineae bacterium]
MIQIAFQDFYEDDTSYCYGCGRLNEAGLQIKTVWDGDESVTVYRPKSQHIAIPGYVYGGLIASLIDCHGTGTAAAAAYRQLGVPMDDPNYYFRYVTGSLHVDYLQPTPLGVDLTIRGEVVEIKGRKTVVRSVVYAEGVHEPTARGEVVAIQMPRAWVEEMVAGNS